MVAIVDYDAGNIKSVEKALQYIGEHPVITRDVKEIKKADHVIVPGVGAFEDAMEKMNRYELAKVRRMWRHPVRRLWAFVSDYSCFLSEAMSQNMM